MSEEKMLTVREVSVMLGVTEKDVLDLTESQALPGYKVGGVYLRFKKEQVEQYRKNKGHLHPKAPKEVLVGAGDKIHDFFYFNDFYIAALVIIIILGFLVYRNL